MKKLLLLAGAALTALTMAACADSTTAPDPSSKVAPSKASHDFECRSGYVVAYDENGNPYCVPE